VKKDQARGKDLTPIQRARRALAVMDDPREVKDYHDKAAAIRDFYARQGQSLELANDAAEHMLWSRRRLGELFLGLPRTKRGPSAKDTRTPVREIEEARKELGVAERLVQYWQQESRVPEEDLLTWLAATREAHEQITADGLRRFVGSGGILVTKHRGEMEWYTPEEHIERVRKVLGTIDLDPASTKLAQKIVKAGKFYTEADDGLTQAWFGNVFLNPPYKQPAASAFVNLLCDAYEGSAVDAAILTQNDSTSGCPRRLTVFLHGIFSSRCCRAGSRQWISMQSLSGGVMYYYSSRRMKVYRSSKVNS